MPIATVMVGPGINFQVDANAVILSAANLVIKPVQRMMRENEMAKILQMAKECSRRLQLGTWDVVLLEEGGPTYEILNIISSAPQDDSETFEDFARTVSWDMSDIASVSEWAVMSVFGSRYDSGCEGLYEAVKHNPYGNMSISDVLKPLLALVRTCQRCNVRQFLLSVSNIRSNAYMPVRLPHVPHFRGGQCSWSEGERARYAETRSEAAKLLHMKLFPDFGHLLNRERRTAAPTVRRAMAAIAEMMVDAIATLILANRRNVLIPSCNLRLEDDCLLDSLIMPHLPQALGKPETILAITLCRLLSVVHSHYRMVLLRHQYRCRLEECILNGKRDVGIRTNLNRLCALHQRNESRKASPTVWSVMKENIVLCSRFVDRALEIEDDVSIGQMEKEWDVLGMMLHILGGTVEESHDLHTSWVQNVILEFSKDSSRDSKNFNRMLTRRSVRLLQCGEDRALVLPYLNTIILELKRAQWANDFDLDAMQPIPVSGLGFKNAGGVVRRTANILLAIDFKMENNAEFVNANKYRMLLRGAREGKLFTKEMRNELIQGSKVKHRLAIRKLKSIASKVFPEEPMMAAALVREMVHDRMLMPSVLPKHRVELEYDAYFDLFYRKFGICIGNNVCWDTGVPLGGIRLKRVGLDCYQVLDAPDDCNVTVVLSKQDGKYIDLCNSSSSDLDTPSAYIASTKCRSATVYQYKESENIWPNQEIVVQAGITVGHYTEIRYSRDPTQSALIESRSKRRGHSR